MTDKMSDRMSIYILSAQKDVARLIAKRLEILYGHKVRVFCDSRLFYEAAYMAQPDEIDLLACDYLAFGNEDFNPFEGMKRIGKVFPFIYYNNPFAAAEFRVDYWIYRMSTQLEGFLSQERINSIHLLLKQIDEILSSEDVFHCINLMNPPCLVKDEDAEFIREYAQRRNISKSRRDLLLYFYKNLDREIGEEDICQTLWKDSAERKKSVLYSYISDLRAKCSLAVPSGTKGSDKKFLFLRTRKHFYKMIIG